MELFKLLLLIACSAALIFLVLPALTVFFIFRARDLQGSAKWAKAGVIVFIVLTVVLVGVIIWDAVDLLMTNRQPELPAEPSTVETTTEPTQPPQTAEPSETTQATEPAETQQEQGATIGAEQLDGLWIASSVPVVPEDENYTYMADAGYYFFTADGIFTYTQLRLARAGRWKVLDGSVTYKGTYLLEGDLLTLHYTLRTEQAGGMTVTEAAVDETDTVSMRINQSCTDMCVLAPEHPRLGQLLLFRKGRGEDPVTALLVVMNSET